MPKTPTPRPVEIPFFGTGFYTYRSQLYAPFRSMGVNIVIYHDSVIDGADFELTDLMEWQQRPGFTKFCAQQLNTDEVINQFYSARALNSVLLPMFDSNQRLAKFDNSSITTIYTKNTTAQGYVSQVGDTTYFADGTDAIRYDQIYGVGPIGIATPTFSLSAATTGGWSPNTFYSLGSVLLDYNGNVQYTGSYISNISAVFNTGTKNPTTVAQVGTGWRFLNMMIFGNGAKTPTGRSTLSGDTTSMAYINHCGFNVPATAIVLGVSVSFEGLAVYDSGPTGFIRTSLLANTTQLGVSKDVEVPQGIHNGVGQFSVVVPGGAYDQWGNIPILTPAVVNNSNFGVGFSAPFGQCAVFDVQMTVFYTFPGSGSGTSGTSGKSLPVWSAIPGSSTTDGSSLRWLNLGSIGQWLPGIAYTFPSVVLDPFGNLQLLTGAPAVAVYDDNTTYASGQIVAYGGLFWTSQQSNTGNPPNQNTTKTTTSGSTNQFSYNWVQTGNPITSGSTNPIWNLTINGLTLDGPLTWTNIGPGTIFVSAGYSWGTCIRTLDGHLSTMTQPTLNTGPMLGGAALAPIVTTSWSITSNVATFLGNQTFAVGELIYITGLTVGSFMNNTPLAVISSIPPGQFTITKIALTTNVLTITCENSLIAGQQVTLSGVGTSTFLNGATVTVLSTGLSTTQFEANFTQANVTVHSDIGTITSVSQFTVAVTHADNGVVFELGTVIPVLALIGGQGLSDSRTTYSTTITEVGVVNGLVTITANNIFFPGTTIQFSGLTGATFLNGLFAIIQTATPTQFTIQLFGDNQNLNYTQVSDTGTATFAAIEIYRTADGGGIWYYSGAVVNPGNGVAWQFVDVNPDIDLTTDLIAPISHLNDPPVGQAGSIAAPSTPGTVLAYWQGRLWMASGQYLYFDAGSDCLNGDPHQSWPPANRFEYAGQVVALTPLGHGGMLVWMSDRLGIVVGGPQTLTFYPDTIMHNFGITSPNAIYQDGQTLHLISTQGQAWAMTLQNKENEGHFVSDFIATNFPPPSSYVTVHRNGNDVGLFLSNGSTTVLRHGLNVGAWSVPYYPVGGVGALASIETTVGFYSLVAAPTTPAGFILARNLNAWADFGGQYTSAFATNECGITLGSITLSAPGEPLFPVQHIVGYFDAVGENGLVDQPSCFILPNEISAKTGIGFFQIPQDQIIPEPPIGALPSTTLQQLRFPVNMANTQASQLMHHLQVKITFPSTNAPHTIKSLAIKADQE